MHLRLILIGLVVLATYVGCGGIAVVECDIDAGEPAGNGADSGADAHGD